MTDINPAAETTDVTKLEDIRATRVDGVLSPANGTPFLLIKALAPAAEPTREPEAPNPLSDTSTTTKDTEAPKEPENKTDSPPAVTEELVKSMITEAVKPYQAANDELRGELQKLREAPIPGGPFFTAPNKRPAESKVSKAVEYERNAAVPGLDRELASYYQSEARRLRAEADAS